MFGVIFILVSTTLSHVYSKPATDEKNQPELDNLKHFVELRSQPPPDTKDPSLKALIDAKTEEILRKIAEVNDNHGLVHKSKNQFKFRYPIPYSRSQYKKQQSDNLEFLKHVFSNPILEYLKTERENNALTTEFPDSNPRLRLPVHDESQGENYLVKSDNNSEEKGSFRNDQQIKRQITHYQFLIPGAVNPFNVPPNQDILGAPVPVSPQGEYQSFPPIQQSRQNWNWPGAGFFPIYIRDPFLQMYYAITNMVEYGPNAGQGGPCKLTPSRRKPTIKLGPETPIDTNPDHDNLTNDSPTLEKIVTFEMKNEDEVLDLEDAIADDNDDQFQFTIKSDDVIRGRESVDDILTPQKIKVGGKNSAKRNFKQSAISPPIRDQTVFVDEVEEQDPEAEKQNINVSNEGSRKVFSKDNTGNGIFIHKIKVRQGGVAIAGPGGIASAGDGGTAIVGPNGVAYTTRDGLAIVGSGSKVVGVEHNDVVDILNSLQNNTKTDKNKVVSVFHSIKG